MDIKEIALRLLAEEFPGMHQENQAFMVEFATALISAYKAELLKEVGEPVAYQVGNSYPRLDGTMAKIVGIGNQTVFDDEGCHYYNRAQDRGRVTGTAHDYSYPRNLVRYYTSDQLATAILKATKPLEEVKEALGEYICSADDSPAAVRRLVSAYQERNNSAAKYCSQLNEQDAELEAEVERLKRTNSSYANLTKAQESQLTNLRQRLYQLKGADSAIDSERQANCDLTEQLAAEQLNNKRLREALTTCVCAMQDYQAGIGITEMFDNGERLGRKALAIPASTETLDAYVKQKIKEYY